jgi:putative hemolysin
MLLLDTPVRAQARHRLTVSLAESRWEVLEAQRLRFKVFAEEMGARLPSAQLGLDRDMYDPYCEHLVAREEDTGEVVGTYRILTSHQAERIGGFYSDEEFDLTRFQHLRDRMLEVGRSCVHPDHRNGTTIALLWSGLARFILSRGYEYVIGCASIGMGDGGNSAASIYNSLRRIAMSPIEYRVFPRHPLALGALDGSVCAPVPPLIKGYVRLGAYVCGEPAWDPDFNTADLLMLLPLARVEKRYARHFLKDDRQRANVLSQAPGPLHPPRP